MRKTRLFSALVLYGASITGGGVATVATVSLAVSGCDDDTTSSQFYPDIGVPFLRDLAVSYPDIGVPPFDMAEHD